MELEIGAHEIVHGDHATVSANLEDATRSASEFAEGIRRDPSLILRGREVGADPAAQ